MSMNTELTPDQQDENRKPILEIRNLDTAFRMPGGNVVHAVNGVSFSLYPGEMLGVVGESGSGKSVTAMSVLGLIAKPNGVVSGDGIFFEGQNINELSDQALRKIRGNKISMIFQEPMTSLNPVFTIGSQLIEAIRLHKPMSRKQALERGVEMLNKVGIPEARRRMHDYPHQLSGGMRQRVMIAMSLSCNPDILLADEPTTALDVTIQAQIVELMVELKEELGTAIMLISHDLGLIAETCQRVIVMYAGKIVEQGRVEDIFRDPKHPYTVGLLNSIPKLPTKPGEQTRKRLEGIPGVVPNLANLPVGCSFHPRCSHASDLCRQTSPDILEAAPGHSVRCWLHNEHPEQ